MVLKYVPYGNLEDVVPYLARRAVENKSVLGGGGGDGESSSGGAGLERKMVGRKIWRRIFG